MSCLDSSFLIDLFSGDPEALAFLEESSGELFAPAVALAEVYEGFEWMDEPDKVETLGWITPLPFDEASARETARIVVTLEERGEPIKYTDAQIAGTVLARDGTLVTRVAEFERVPGLDVLSY
jgi:predicted nucleic acid-binding protein